MKNRSFLFRLAVLVAAMMCALGMQAAFEAFACYRSWNTTLTFYYDNHRDWYVSLRGDVDADGNVTISDVTALIDYLLAGSW
ncbi:MAG: hypothetical protein IJJ83_11925 [Muribaculaceae bacterium]|nr:hypothetical protein [Muribaculaceae bacterium]